MTDDTTKRGQHDRIRINVKQAFEVRHWTQALGVTRVALTAAVKAVGPMVQDVKRYLIERIQSAK